MHVSSKLQNEALEYFRKFKAQVEEEGEVCIKCLRTDREGQFLLKNSLISVKNREFKDNSLSHIRTP